MTYLDCASMGLDHLIGDVVVMSVLLQAQAASTTCRLTIAADDGQLGDVKDLP